MNCKLTTHKLGKLLSELSEKYSINVLWKAKINGGFITMNGEVTVEYYPTEQVMLKGNNILSLKIKNGGSDACSVKITGIKGEIFNVDIAPTKFKEVKSNSLYLDKIQESKTECKIRIDENVIFTIPDSYDEVIKFID